jgi:hypothetical protein
VLIDGSSVTTCTATYVAPGSGAGERLTVTAADNKGGSTTGAISFGLGPESVGIGGPSPQPDPNPQPNPPPSPQPAPTPNPTPSPNPGPTPNPQPTPTPQPNGAPTVSVSSTGTACHPSPSSPCSIPVQAQASDPDGDVLTYAWQGCASGSSLTSSCSVTSPGVKTATITVTDTKGMSATASVNLTGMNNAPNISNCRSDPDPLPSNTGGTWMFSSHDLDGDSYSARMTKNGPGPCVAYLDTNCEVGRGICSFNSKTGPGTCNMTITVTDAWGATSSASCSVWVQ